MFTVTRSFCRMLVEGNKLNVISVDCSVILGTRHVIRKTAVTVLFYYIRQGEL